MGACSFIAVVTIACLALLSSTGQCADRGIVYLGSYTFYRIVDSTRNVLVRFDKKHYWHTGFDTAFEDLALKVTWSHENKSPQNDCNLIVGSLPVSKQDHEKDNVVISKRYNISKASFPALRLFKKGVSTKDAPEKLPPHVPATSAAAMMLWIEEETGIFCAQPGQLRDFHVLAQKLLKGGDSKELLAEATTLVDKMDAGDKAHAKQYVDVFKKAVEDPEWPYNEHQHLKKTLPKYTPHVAPDAYRDAQHVRFNILTSFIDTIADENEETKTEL